MFFDQGYAVAALICASVVSSSGVLGGGVERVNGRINNQGEKQLPVAGEVFKVGDHVAFLIMPAKGPTGNSVPWVWYAPTLHNLPGPEEKWMFEQFLGRGIAIAGVDVGESYGSPDGRKIFSALYQELVGKRGFSPKACLLARSRGGLMLYNWAVENPEAVACIAGIYPVGNLTSYPGLAKACGAYHMTAEQLAEVLPKHNPIDRLAPLAAAKVPIFHIHGDRDKIVPIEANSALVAARYKEMGGAMTLEVVKGGGHDMSPAWFHNQALVDFVIQHAGGSVPAPVQAEDLNGVRGNIFHVDQAGRHFELLKETVFDPKTNEGRSRHTVYWTPETRFIKVIKQNSFEGVGKPVWAQFQGLTGEVAAVATVEKPFVTTHVTILAEGEEAPPAGSGGQGRGVRFTADPASDHHRGGAVELDGRQVPVRLRGPQSEVFTRTGTTEGELGKGFWETELRGSLREGRFVADRMEIYPLVDPRAIDDPKLPRVLVVGDSISMNYHEAAKAGLKGIANYYRVEGNAGPSDRGVACMELWLGDYQQKGLHWDLIQFNHGLHDLKQAYDEATGSYGAYQISLEEYKANLEREIAIMKKTGARLVWCSTTPVPNNSHGVWDHVAMGRRKDEDLVFNKAAMEVIGRHPEILVNDLNGFVRNSSSFDKWRQGTDVHFWGGPEQALVGKAVADAIRKALVSL